MCSRLPRGPIQPERVSVNPSLHGHSLHLAAPVNVNYGRTAGVAIAANRRQFRYNGAAGDPRGLPFKNKPGNFSGLEFNRNAAVAIQAHKDVTNRYVAAIPAVKETPTIASVLKFSAQPACPLAAPATFVPLPIHTVVPIAVAAIVKVAAAGISPPFDVEGIPLAAALRILEPDDRWAATSWFAHKRLAPASVNPGKAKLRWVHRHGLIADEAAPFRPLAGERSQFRAVSADDDLGYVVHYDFDGALAVVTTTAYVGTPALGAAAPLSEYAKTCQKQGCSQSSHSVSPPRI